MRNAIAFNRSPTLTCLCVVASFLALVGCGGGGSQSPPPPPPPPPEITGVSVTPNSAYVLTGASQLFTAQVTGTGAFNASVTWSVEGVNGGNSTFGTIVGGEYTAPAVLPTPSGVTITATSVQDSYAFNSATAVLYAPPTLTSIRRAQPAPGADNNQRSEFGRLGRHRNGGFLGANGTSISMPVEQVSATAITATVPFGAATGPVYVNVTPFVNINIHETTNWVPLTRLPNLRVHAANKDLSSGERLQLDWRLLGRARRTL